jgi:ribosomal protein L16 Arg81 hydroxylase
MEDEISVPFQTNIYLTPGQALGGPETTQGFRIHYDTHDVFALQVEGRKTWKIYHEPVRLPHRAQHYNREEHGCPDPSQTFELEAGDVVYIPRGWVHSAEAGQDLSLHITLGVMAYRWSELLIEAVSELSLRDEEFRRCLPVGFGRGGFDRTAVREKAKELLQRLVDAADLDGAFDHFSDRLLNSRGAVLRGQMTQLVALKNLTVNSWVGARAAVIHRFEETEDKIIVRAYGKQTTMPIYAAEALRYALSSARYRVADIPGSLDEPGKLTLIRRLVREGLVKVHDPLTS